MCEKTRATLNLIREYTREIFTFGGVILAVFVYMDFRETVKDMGEINRETAEVLRSVDMRLNQLEFYHATESKNKE